MVRCDRQECALSEERASGAYGECLVKRERRSGNKPTMRTNAASSVSTRGSSVGTFTSGGTVAFALQVTHASGAAGVMFTVLRTALTADAAIVELTVRVTVPFAGTLAVV